MTQYDLSVGDCCDCWNPWETTVRQICGKVVSGQNFKVLQNSQGLAEFALTVAITALRPLQKTART